MSDSTARYVPLHRAPAAGPPGPRSRRAVTRGRPPASSVDSVTRPELRVVCLPGGEDLAWMEVGAPRGAPIFAFHGSPGRSYEFVIYDELARDRKVRLIAPDRPGYGHSTYQAKRKLSDFPRVISHLADHLSVGTFAVLGHSQGGPHALSCARFLPNRVTGCAVISGLAPPGEPGMTEGAMLLNRLGWATYSRWPPALDGLAAVLGWLVVPIAAAFLRYGLRNPESGLDRFVKMLPDCDAQVVGRPQVRAQLLAEAREFTLATARTNIQDMALGMRRWDFCVKDIEVPVDVWHGDRDRNVPFVQGELLAREIPGAALHACPGEGHWLIVDHMKEVLDRLASSLVT